MEKWFKFYSADYMLDGKIRQLDAIERSCWLTLLCLADMSDIPGEVRNVKPEDLLVLSGIIYDPDNEMKRRVWDDTLGVLTHLTDLGMIEKNDNGMITVINFRKRQGRALNTYQRVKKHRLANKDMITESNEVGSSLEEKRREEIFNSSDYIADMIKNKTKHIHIIGLYYNFKEFNFPGIDAIRFSVRRDLRGARALTDYTDELIIQIMGDLQKRVKENKLEKWTLETVGKYINES